MSNGRFEITLSLPTELNVPCGGGRGEAPIGHTKVPLADFTKEVIQLALVNGLTGALNDISRGKDDKDKPNTDDVWLAARQKRVDAWSKGVWAKGERGDTNLSLVKDQYYFELMTERQMTTKKIDAEIKAVVEAHMPKDTKASFQNFMQALAIAHLPKGDEGEREALADQIEAALLERAMKRQAAAEKAKDAIVVPDLSALLGKPAAE